jgi:hypothetical protein
VDVHFGGGGGGEERKLMWDYAPIRVIAEDDEPDEDEYEGYEPDMDDIGD